MYSLRLDSAEQIFTAQHGIQYICGEWEELHEHTFRVVLILSGLLNSVGYVVDFHEISKILSKILDSLNGKILISETESALQNRFLTDLHGENVVRLPIKYTTAELLAKYIAEEFLRQTQSFFEPTRITVELEESPGYWGIFCLNRKSKIGEQKNIETFIPPASSLQPPAS